MDQTAREIKYASEIEDLAKKICQEIKGFCLAKHIDYMINAFVRYSEDDECERVLHYFTLPNWIRRLEADIQINDERGRQLTVRRHCYLLGCAVYHIGFLGYFRDSAEMDGENVGWLGASEWLDIAAGVERVEVNTLYFDQSIMYCGTAYDYENARSDLLSHLVTQLAIFNFTWGGFETIIKLIDPPRVPQSIKPRSSIIDHAIFFLRNEYEPARMLAFYDDTVAELREIMRQLPYYNDLLSHFHLQEFLGVSGIGINIVRRIRNRFAHGAAAMPHPNGEQVPELIVARLVELSTRIVLYTIQMLLLAYLKGKDFEIECREDEWGIMEPENVHLVLQTLHLEKKQNDENQLALFV
jgi:hypothetical protein